MTFSVTSISKYSGSSLVSSKSCFTGTQSFLLKLNGGHIHGHTILGNPAFMPALICVHAVLITHSPMGTISLLSSARGMKSIGTTNPLWDAASELMLLPK